MASLLEKAVAKATFDPALEKQIADNKQQAREARAALQKAVNTATAAERTALQDGKLTSVGATYLQVLFTETTQWLDTTPNATAQEVLDKNNEFAMKLAQLYTDDANRLYYSNSVLFWQGTLLSWEKTNKISEGVSKKTTAILDSETTWFKKHPDEALQTYQDRLAALRETLFPVLNDPVLQKEATDGLERVKAMDTSKEMLALQANAAQAARDKAELERQNFSVSRTFSKTLKGTGIAFIVALILTFGFLGAALASNYAISRSVPIRILCWLYGFVFSLPVLGFFLIRYYKGIPPVFYAYLIPLSVYVPPVATPLQTPSFLERLVSYTPLPPST